MREIKFRAWTGKKMLYQKDRDENFVATDGFNSLAYRPITALQGDSNHYQWMQFTGLLDKNGKEIYEGDIIEIEEDEGVDVYQNWVKHRDEVIYSNGCYFGIFGLPLYELIQEPHDYNLEVIGNIYENPEIITEQSDQ